MRAKITAAPSVHWRRAGFRGSLLRRRDATAEPRNRSYFTPVMAVAETAKFNLQRLTKKVF